MWILCWTLIFLCGVKGGASLHCFNCSSNINDKCAILESSDTLSPYYTTCNGSCALTKVVELVNGQYSTRTVRKCVNEIHPHECVIEDLVTTSVEKNKTCYCNTDGCNGENYNSEAVNLTTKGKLKRADVLYCFRCSTLDDDEGCAYITTHTIKETHPYYKVCDKGACGLVVMMVRSSDGTPTTDVVRTCVMSLKTTEGCTDLPTPTRAAGDKSWKKGIDCLCRKNGCNAGNPLYGDYPQPGGGRPGKKPKDPTPGKKPDGGGHRFAPPEKPLMCYTCSTESNLGCDTVRVDDYDSVFYNRCAMKNAKCLFIFQQKLDGGDMHWFYLRKCGISTFVGCTESDAEDGWKMNFDHEGYSYGCVCTTDGCNGGHPTDTLSGSLWMKAEKIRSHSTNTTAPSGASVSRPLIRTCLWAILWAWTMIG